MTAVEREEFERRADEYLRREEEERDAERGQYALNRRLRDEAGEWEDGESVKGLLIEAAEAIEQLAAHAAWEAARNA